MISYHSHITTSILLNHFLFLLALEMDFKLSHSLSTKQLFKQISLFVLFPFFLNSNQNWWDCPPSDPLFSNVCLFSHFFVSVLLKFLSPLLFLHQFCSKFCLFEPSTLHSPFTLHSFGSDCLSGWENKRWKDVGIVTSVIINIVSIVIINIVIINIIRSGEIKIEIWLTQASICLNLEGIKFSFDKESWSDQ